jgi:phospholipid-binding lipoprotein MlaA
MRLILRRLAWPLLIGPAAGLLGASGTAALAQDLVDPGKEAPGEEYLYEPPQEHDPFESLNRQIYDFNQIFHDYASDPAIRVYGDYVPEGVRSGVANFFGNLREPFSAVNSALAGDWSLSGHYLQRFAVNSTFGLLGVLDVAQEVGIEKREAYKFNELMCTYDIPPGPFIVLPLLGPSNVRGITGRVADIVTSATVTGDFAQIYLPGVYAHDFMSGREVEKAFTEGAIDPYAVVRSAYAQLASTCGGRKQRGASDGSGMDTP